ncbi:hypothetical protein FRC16_009591 [Serendipita sp. 398]|nr:hypothetical protein FRC16_009591 [Serendipita sp. 398]
MIGFRALVVALGSVASVSAIGSPFGFARSTTGGAGGTQVTPTTTAQLVSYLSDSTTRTIILTTMFDFSNYYGTTTGTICKPWSCSPNPQWMIDSSNHWCDSYASTKTTGTYYNSGTSTSYALKVGSNKTLLGQGSSAGIKGIGLLIAGVSNVIIQNINIVDIKHCALCLGWRRYQHSGLFARLWVRIQFDTRRAKLLTVKTGIDHNYIKNVGRQFIVTGFDPATQVTISNNFFDGQATYSTGCDGHHYWVALFAGKSDTITFARNYVYYTAGRGPHTGGTSGYYQWVHITNNYFNNISGHAIDSSTGSVVLVEGNYFNSVTTPSVSGSAGNEYFITSSSHVSTCTSTMGRTCQANTLASSGSVSHANTAVLTTLESQSAVVSYVPMAASAVPAFVLANAGTGKIN